MQLCAVLTKEDLTSVIEQVTPLRVEIRPRRVITLARPTAIELVAGAGLRVRGHASFTWDVGGGLTIPVTLRSWQVLLVPSFVARHGRHVLAFNPKLEKLDFKRVPVFLGDRIAEALKEGLAAQRNKLAWDFAKHLSVVLPFPNRVSPGGEAWLGPTGGNVTVTAAEVRLTLTFAVRVKREAAPAPLRRPEAAATISPLAVR
jgi:hypothetical protein